MAAGGATVGGDKVTANDSAKGKYPGFYNYIGTNMTPFAILSNGSFKISYNVITINITLE